MIPRRCPLSSGIYFHGKLLQRGTPSLIGECSSLMNNISEENCFTRSLCGRKVKFLSQICLNLYQCNFSSISFFHINKSRHLFSSCFVPLIYIYYELNYYFRVFRHHFSPFFIFIFSFFPAMYFYNMYHTYTISIIVLHYFHSLCISPPRRFITASIITKEMQSRSNIFADQFCKWASDQVN